MNLSRLTPTRAATLHRRKLNVHSNSRHSCIKTVNQLNTNRSEASNLWTLFPVNTHHVCGSDGSDSRRIHRTNQKNWPAESPPGPSLSATHRKWRWGENVPQRIWSDHNTGTIKSSDLNTGNAYSSYSCDPQWVRRSTVRIRPVNSISAYNCTTTVKKLFWHARPGFTTCVKQFFFIWPLLCG